MTNHSNSGNGEAGVSKDGAGNGPALNRDAVMATINELQGSLDELRLAMKYLIFDLEATRRENTHLRSLLVDQSDDEAGPPDETPDNN